MKTKNITSYFGLILILLLVSGCEDLLRTPYNAISEETFWKNKEDALIGLAGVYSVTDSGDERDFLTYQSIFFMDQKSDNCFERVGTERELIINGQLNPTNSLIGSIWKASYNRIGKANYFLENIDRVKMEEAEKAEMKAEARFFRAVYYFYMSQFWGSVPLIDKTLSVNEANSIGRSSKEEIVNFVLIELTEAATDLPDTRPDSERGRITKAAALAFKGRLLMAENNWSEAASTYIYIIDLGVHSIDPRYKEIFLEEGEDSPENIFSIQYLGGAGGKYSSQVMQRMAPYMIQGYTQVGPLNDLVKSYECVDGKPISESQMYDPENPFVKDGTAYRDPRLYYTIALPYITSIRGKIYISHPDSVNAPDRLGAVGKTGYGWLKFVDEDYLGDLKLYGGDVPVIRYAEVLLSYLESKLEAGDAITQDLLDQTINKVRGRATVNMPPVTEKNRDKLRMILRRERRVELALEGIRLWDLFRWHTAHIVLNRDVYGAKVCDTQGNCGFMVDDEGHYFIANRGFRENIDYQWPVPQSERDVNPNMEQTSGY